LFQSPIVELVPGAGARLFESPSIDGWSFLLLLSGIACFGVFTWGARAHFVRDRTAVAMHALFLLSLAGMAVFLFALWRAPAADWRRAVGFCLHLLAIVLFGWAVLATRQNRPALAFAGDRPDHLFRSGPYAYMRHPFYTSYLLFWLGCALGASSVILMILFPALTAIYTVAAVGEERDFSRSAIHAEYEAFRRETGFFWPKLRLARRQP
jgi:protein-S-isoprenylcysteine O-methyltransferase Ste14